MPRAISRAEVTALALIAALTLWRMAWLPGSDLEFYVDEAQYWLWGQELAAGAWSKPPLVGWLIRLGNEIAGTDAPWAARLPWPLVHGAAATAVMALGRVLAGPAVAALAGVIYVTLPAVSLGSILISTDSPQMLALALFLLAWARLPGRVGAVLAGAALAAGMWSKYAMLFPLPGLAVAAAIDPRWRRPWGQVALVAGTAGLLLAPNLAWNLAHGMATIRHATEHAAWEGALQPGEALRFLVEQFAVAGPLTFAALLLALPRRWPPGLRGLVPVALAPLVIVAVQAMRSGANANWAVGAYVAGAVLMAAWLARRPRLAVAAVALNGILATGLPVIGSMAGDLRRDGRPLLVRYVGNVATADAIIRAAGDAGARLLVSDDRALLAQLTWRTRSTGADLAVRAVPGLDGPVPSHYDLTYPLRDEPGPALWIGQPERAPRCTGPTMRLPPGEGELGGRDIAAAVLAPSCLDRLRR